MFRRCSAPLALLAAFAVPLAPRALHAQDAVAKEILRLENAWAAAQVKHDAATVAALVSDDCLFAAPDGTLQTKAQVVASINTPIQYAGTLNRDARVRVHGNTAMITGLYTETVKSPKGNVAITYRYTDTWMKQDNGKWLYIGGQSTRLP